MIDEQNELLIQKCVDGELDVETQQQLLAQLDIVAEGWKILALAYVEEQTWTESFCDNNRAARALEDRAFAPSADMAAPLRPYQRVARYIVSQIASTSVGSTTRWRPISRFRRTMSSF